MPLNEEQLKCIKAAIPLLQDNSASLASAFYTKMIDENPQLMNFFNSAHQATKSQPRALTHALLMYAQHIENLEALNALVARIVDKHVALQIPASGYPIVGKYLLGAISDVVGPEVATPVFLDAWATAYGMLADLLIRLEQKKYEENAEAGWKAYRTLKVVKKVKETENVVSLYLRRSNDEPFLLPKPGQYLGIRFNIAGRYQPREYSISAFDARNKLYRISVKRIPNGVVSNHIHDHVNVGDLIEAVAPEGTFHVQPGAKDVTLVAAGIGITPFITMSQELVNSVSLNKLRLVLCDESESSAPFIDYFDELTRDNKENHKVDCTRVYSKINGRLSKEKLLNLCHGTNQVYVVGPPGFMADVRQWLEQGTIGIETFYDFFGPTQWE